MRFEKRLNSYQKILLAKLTQYTQDFETEKGFLSNKLALYNFPKALAFNSRKGVDYNISRMPHYPSYAFTNQQIEAVNEHIVNFRKSGKNLSQMQELFNSLSTAATAIGCGLADFEFLNAKRANKKIQFDALRPDNYIIDDCRNANRLLSLVQLHGLPPAVLNVPFLFLKGVCLFSMLSAVITDVAQSRSNYKETLYFIKNAILNNFRNACLFKIQFPKTKITNNNICSRGKNDNTTVMRLYLIDENDECVVLRLDLPHSNGENAGGKIQLHFNVFPKDYKGLNHLVIPSEYVDDELNDVFDDVALYVKETMPDLVEFVDSPKEGQVLTEMQKFKLFNKWCCMRIDFGAYEKETNKLTDMFKIKNDTPNDILTEILKTYSI